MCVPGSMGGGSARWGANGRTCSWTACGASKGRYGYRRVKAALRTRVSEKVLRRIMAEDGLTAHVLKRRRYSSYEGETTPAPGNLVNRDFTAEMPNEKWLTDITEIKARDDMQRHPKPPLDQPTPARSSRGHPRAMIRLPATRFWLV